MFLTETSANGGFVAISDDAHVRLHALLGRFKLEHATRQGAHIKDAFLLVEVGANPQIKPCEEK